MKEHTVLLGGRYGPRKAFSLATDVVQLPSEGDADKGCDGPRHILFYEFGPLLLDPDDEGVNQLRTIGLLTVRSNAVVVDATVVDAHKGVGHLRPQV